MPVFDQTGQVVGHQVNVGNATVTKSQTQKMYIATVQVLIPVDNETDACDFVSEQMRESGFADWVYLKLGAQRTSPVEIYVPDPYEELDIMRRE